MSTVVCVSVSVLPTCLVGGKEMVRILRVVVVLVLGASPLAVDVSSPSKASALGVGVDVDGAVKEARLDSILENSVKKSSSVSKPGGGQDERLVLLDISLFEDKLTFTVLSASYEVCGELLVLG